MTWLERFTGWTFDMSGSVQELIQQYKDMTVQEADNIGPSTGICDYCGQEAGLGEDGKCKWCRHYHRELAGVFAQTEQ